ncbi:hypothetical protein D1609_03265 [Leptospira borgpetersenii serovar Hardjo-bovis]|nr:hypothetical protein B9T54_03310 [Leptospira borgpetersenii serovar Hardjo-bovis]AYR07706.1 hypothetical protein D1609_03265 [Leptospira borgpetersenii serovar Hardjo-bovis]TQE52826.1 hypothetical protein FFZ95_09215 [Leptospira borgpetersenii]TQE56005.1 hypothetical protein FFZ96_11050 [Leptospira borgpetersenii]
MRIVIELKQFSHLIVMRMKYRFQWNYKKAQAEKGKRLLTDVLKWKSKKNVIKEVESYKSVFRFLV